MVPIIATGFAPLADTFGVGIGLGVVAGGLVAFALRAQTNRKLLENIALGTAVGGFVGAVLALAAWLGSVLAGA